MYSSNDKNSNTYITDRNKNNNLLSSRKDLSFTHIFSLRQKKKSMEE